MDTTAVLLMVLWGGSVSYTVRRARGRVMWGTAALITVGVCAAGALAGYPIGG